MGKLPHKIKQLHKNRPANLHRHMLSVKYDTVLIVINIFGTYSEKSDVPAMYELMLSFDSPSPGLNEMFYDMDSQM